MSSDAGAHTLGPHVVGQRVVVRRVLPGETGPSGGPAMADVLGTCTAWGDGVCVVTPDRGGEPVAIPLADIVSGKPVPPRASPRMRVSPDEAQRRALSMWPGLETQPLGDWLLRRSASTTARRANSVLAMGPSGVAEAYEQVVAFYRALRQRPIAAVVPDSAEEDLFRSHGWVLESHDGATVFQLMSVARLSRALARDDRPAVAVTEEGELATATIGSRATGVAALHGDWVGLRSIAVDPAHRRQGLAHAVMAGLVDWAAERGATTAYLQVLDDNEPALALYDRLGFVEHHRYRYLAEPLRPDN